MTLPRHKDVLDQMHADLHDLCQPLTALQCRLEIGRMTGDEGGLLGTIDGGLEETKRMFEVINRIRKRLLSEEETHE